MAVRTPRRPRTIRLPFGYSIKVRYVTPRVMRRIIGDVAGGWDANLQTIYVLSTDPLWEQIDTIGHELTHALVDWRHHLATEYCRPLITEAATTQAALAEGEDDT